MYHQTDIYVDVPLVVLRESYYVLWRFKGVLCLRSRGHGGCMVVTRIIKACFQWSSADQIITEICKQKKSVLLHISVGLDIREAVDV